MNDDAAPSLKTFNARLPFPHNPPFPAVFAERVPLLYALRLAILQFETRTNAYPSSFREFISKRCGLELEKPFVLAECGVYRGSSLLASGRLLTELGVRAELFGLDTFLGLPKMSEMDRKYLSEKAPYEDKLFFSDTSMAEVMTALLDAKLWGEIQLIPGLFKETLPKLRDKMYDFVNIDCDLYEPHIQCLEYFYPRMHRGGTIFFDDYYSASYPMARAAIDFFMKGKPETLMHLRYGEDAINHTKVFFVKL